MSALRESVGNHWLWELFWIIDGLFEDSLKILELELLIIFLQLSYGDFSSVPFFCYPKFLFWIESYSDLAPFFGLFVLPRSFPCVGGFGVTIHQHFLDVFSLHRD